MPFKGYLDQSVQHLDDRGQSRRHLFLETSGSSSSGEENVVIHNVSATGMLLETSMPLSRHEALQVELPQAGMVDATVVWASGLLFGCAFEQPLSQEALSAAELKASAPFTNEIGQTAALRRAGGEFFGQKIEKLRKERGLTLAQVAEELGVSKPTVWAWEKGKARPVAERLPVLAKALGVEEGELTQGHEPPGLAELVESSRKRIADAYGVGTDAVRIMIEI